MKDIEISSGGDGLCAIERLNYDLTKLVHKRDWFMLWGEIYESLTENCSMFLLDRLCSGTPMATLFICSGGGSEDDARALIGIIEHCKSQGMIIRMFGAGMVASAAFDVFVAGSKGYRFVSELTMFMTHSSSIETRDKPLRRLQEELDEYTLQAYTRIHKKARERYLETGNWYFSADEGLAFGAADAVLKPGDKLPSEAMKPKKAAEAVVESSQEKQSVG